MGGIGSGRGNQFGKDTTSDYRALDVRRLQRDSLLAPWRAFSWSWKRNGETVASIQVRTEVDNLILNYRHRSRSRNWKSEEYSVRLDWTDCTLGGRRAWFRCPATGCGRRVALLYLGGAGIFACRHCHRLAYASQREAADSRATRRADKIRERLGWEPGILNGSGCKPKGMHWRTFERLSEKHDLFVGLSMAGMAERLGLLNERLGGIADRLSGKG